MAYDLVQRIFLLLLERGALSVEDAAGDPLRFHQDPVRRHGGGLGTRKRSGSLALNALPGSGRNLLKREKAFSAVVRLSHRCALDGVRRDQAMTHAEAEPAAMSRMTFHAAPSPSRQ